MIVLVGLLGLTIGVQEALEMSFAGVASATIAWDRNYVEKMYREGRFIRIVAGKEIDLRAVAKADLKGDYAELLRPVIERLHTELNSLPIRKAVSEELRRDIMGVRPCGPGAGEDRRRLRELVWGKDLIAPAIAVAPKFGTPHITLTAFAEHEGIALSGLQAYLRIYKEHHLKNQRREAQKAAAWLRSELERASRDLAVSRRDLNAFARENDIVVSDLARSQTVKLLSWSESKVGEVRKRRDDLEKEFRFLTEDAAASEAETAAATVRALREEVVRLEAEYYATVTSQGGDNPVAEAKRRRMGNLREKLAKCQGALNKAALHEADSQRASALVDLRKARKDSMRLGALGPEFRLLTMRLKTNQDLCDMIYEEYRRALRRTSASVCSFRVVDAPFTQGQPRSHAGLMTQWLFIGLWGGLALVLGLDAAHRVMRGDHNLDDLEVPLSLGTVSGFSMRGPGRDGSKAPHFLAYDDPGNPLCDGIRNIQTSIHQFGAGVGSRRLLVTSALPQEGKSFIAAALATALAGEEGKRAIVVDGDLRRPTIHTIFGDERLDPGLSSILGGAPVDSAGLIRESRIPRLYYMTAGAIPRDPVAALASDRFPKLLDLLSEEFDYVVIDGPPVLGMADALHLSRHVDTVLAVVRDGVVTRMEVSEALQKLGGVRGRRILGLVRNAG